MYAQMCDSGYSAARGFITSVISMNYPLYYGGEGRANYSAGRHELVHGTY
jgi:hypothetical protein